VFGLATGRFTHLYSDRVMEDRLNSAGSNLLMPLTRYAVLLAPDFQRSPLWAAESKIKKSCLATTSVTSARCSVLHVRAQLRYGVVHTGSAANTTGETSGKIECRGAECMLDSWDWWPAIKQTLRRSSNRRCDQGAHTAQKSMNICTRLDMDTPVLAAHSYQGQGCARISHIRSRHCNTFEPCQHLFASHSSWWRKIIEHQSMQSAPTCHYYQAVFLLWGSFRWIRALQSMQAAQSWLHDHLGIFMVHKVSRGKAYQVSQE